MDEQATYTVENGLATLTLGNAVGTLKCQIPERMLPTANYILHGYRFTNFENWFDKNQDFGMLFRFVLFMQIYTTSITTTTPQKIRTSLDNMWGKIVEEELAHAMKIHEIMLFQEMLSEINERDNLYIFTSDELINNWDEIEALFQLSYQI